MHTSTARHAYSPSTDVHAYIYTYTLTYIHRHLEAVEALIGHGACADIQSASGWTAMMLAASNWQVKFSYMHVQEGVCVSAFMYLCQCHDVGCKQLAGQHYVYDVYACLCVCISALI